LTDVTTIFLVEFDVYHVPSATALTLRFATDIYVTSAADTPASTLYEARVINPGECSRFMFGEGRSPISGLGQRPQIKYGAIELSIGYEGDSYQVTGSETDSLVFDYAWEGSEVRVLTVERGAAYSTAVEHLRGTVKTIEWDEMSYTVRFNDRLGDLDTSYNKGRLLGTNSASYGFEALSNSVGAVKPMLLGTCYNVTPVVLNDNNLIYGLNFMPDGISWRDPQASHEVELSTSNGSTSRSPLAIAAIDATHAIAIDAAGSAGPCHYWLVSFTDDAVTEEAQDIGAPPSSAEWVKAYAAGNDRVLAVMGTPDTGGSIDLALLSADTSASPKTLTEEAQATVASDDGVVGEPHVIVTIPVDGSSPGDGEAVVVWIDAAGDVNAEIYDFTNSTLTQRTGGPIAIENSTNAITRISACLFTDPALGEDAEVAIACETSGGIEIIGWNVTAGTIRSLSYNSTLADLVSIAPMQAPASNTNASTALGFVLMGTKSSVTAFELLYGDPSDTGGLPVIDTHTMVNDHCPDLCGEIVYHKDSELFAITGSAAQDASSDQRPQLISVLANGLRIRAGGMAALSYAASRWAAICVPATGDSPKVVGCYGVPATSASVNDVRQAVVLTGTRTSTNHRVNSVSSVYDKGIALNAPTVTDFASPAELKAATIGSGDYGTCLDAGMIRLGALADGTVTCDAVSTVNFTANGTAWREAEGVLIDPCFVRGQTGSPVRFDAARWYEAGSLEDAQDDVQSFGVPTMGLYVDRERSALALLTEILFAHAIGIAAQRDGTYAGRGFDGAAPSSGVTINDDDYIDGTLVRPLSKDPGSGIPAYRIRAHYDRNWTVQTGGDLASSVPEESDATSHGRAFLASEYRTAVSEDPTVLAAYRVSPTVDLYTLWRDSETDVLYYVAQVWETLLQTKRGPFRVTVPYSVGYNLEVGKRCSVWPSDGRVVGGKILTAFVSGLVHRFKDGEIDVEFWDLS